MFKLQEDVFNHLNDVIVDTKYNFIAVNVGAYGESSDSESFTNSNLGKTIEQNKL